MCLIINRHAARLQPTPIHRHRKKNQIQLLAFTPFLQRRTQRAVIKIVQLTADRNAMGERGYGDITFRQPVGDIMGSRFTSTVALVARMTSEMASRPARLSSPPILRSSGPMPSSGERHLLKYDTAP